MVDKNDSLLREVEEELRRDQWEKLWNKYGIYVLAAASLVVVLVGGYKFWEGRTLARAKATGAQYEAAMALATAGKSDEAEAALKTMVGEAPAGYRSLAQLSLAGTYLRSGKTQEALATFEALANDRSADPLLTSYAAVQAAGLRLGEADFTEIQNRLNAHSGDDSPWRFSARELLGTAALKAGKLDEARKVFAPLLIDPAVPADMAERVRRMMAAIALTELSKPAGTAGTNAPAASSAPAAGSDTKTPAPAAK